MSDYEDIFAGDGALARNIPGYAPRAVQQLMAEAVGAALDGHGHLVVEAGTGTGKTFAYLVPALLSGRRVVISTGTRTLQDQLFGRDLPMVGESIGRPVKLSLLKGRSNYLCLHRLKLTRHDPDLARRAGLRNLARVAEWSLQTASGDIGELSSVEENARVWPAVTSTTENCLGTKCDHYNDCFVVRARRAAQSADVVIVNHYLLLADMALKEEGFGELLPGADAVIVDEAHQLPDIAHRFFGISASSHQIEAVTRDCLAEWLAAALDAGPMTECVDRLLKTVRDFRLELDRHQGSVEWAPVEPRLYQPLTAIFENLDTLAGLLDSVDQHGDAGLRQCRHRVRLLIERIASFRDTLQDGLRWVDISRRGFSLHLTPFNSAQTLAEHIEAQDSVWVFTSATLAVGDDFQHFCDRLGLSGVDTCRLDSPFDFAQHALLYLPAGLSPPSSPDYINEIIEVMLPVVRASEGRAFFLFTSHRALQRAATHLREELIEALPYPVLVQGEAPRDQLLRRFRELGNAVLLGTASFWEGVDVRGEALSVVMIDKLPFAPPDDPLQKARMEWIRQLGGNPFNEHQLPQAIIALKQGVGRLIRDVNDTGVAVLCDPRLQTRSYGRRFLDALPPMQRTNSIDTVVDFLRSRTVVDSLI